MKSQRRMVYKENMKNGTWQSYPNENFDRTTHLAGQIADYRRETGRGQPAFGYTMEDWAEAEAIVYNQRREV